ncbi:hypothetical protein; putative exported protein [Marinobacter nauticus ATCC 49840]|nr:hypothetical protein; putative exported protein [Marinobacter nauticus ATCC 49840]
MTRPSSAVIRRSPSISASPGCSRRWLPSGASAQAFPVTLTTIAIVMLMAFLYIAKSNKQVNLRNFVVSFTVDCLPIVAYWTQVQVG